MELREKYSAKLVNVLSQSPMFSRVRPAMLEQLSQKTIITIFNADQNIIKKGDEGHTIYFILDGTVKVHDDQHLVALLESEDFFGEMSLLDKEPRSMSVTAVVESVIGIMHSDDFYEVLSQYPELTRDIIYFLSQRLRKQNTTLVDQFRNREAELKRLVEERTADLMKKNYELELAIEEIRKSQEQLIQQEKLASLGSLTAGVAHELHNPLNFVNNFSELSIDLIQDLYENPDSTELRNTLETLKSNLDKILQHGKRAEDIIRSMLMHNSSSTGKKEETQINLICEQAINVSWYGMRLKTPGCSITTEKYFDEKLPSVYLFKQDFTKAIVNILNNAYYSVYRKWRMEGSAYVPSVRLTTYADEKNAIIEIQDNGTGINEVVASRIFEPFYTTKATGEGIGLGLSITNDILTANGGTISVNSKENEYALFKISIPINN